MAKRCCLLFWISFFCISVLKGQEYNVVSYNLNDTPVHAYIPVPGHILHRSQVFFFQPFGNNTLPDLNGMFVFRVDLSKCVPQVQQDIF